MFVLELCLKTRSRLVFDFLLNDRLIIIKIRTVFLQLKRKI